MGLNSNSIGFKWNLMGFDARGSPPVMFVG
jgi:hypothetical protein